jgi:hypothetical protein
MIQAHGGFERPKPSGTSGMGALVPSLTVDRLPVVGSYPVDN